MWADTRNLATFRPERAARLMAATAKAAPDLKRLAGGSRGGRKLAKPVPHHSLSWAQDETPDMREMNRAVDGSPEALRLRQWRGGRLKDGRRRARVEPSEP